MALTALRDVLSTPGRRGPDRREPSGARRRVGRGLGCALLVLKSSGCLLFTDPINEPPQVTIAGPLELYQGQPATFSASVTDDRGTPSLEWARTPTCPTDATAASAALGGAVLLGRSNPVEVKQLEAESFCLWVLARDADGASAFDPHPVSIKVRDLVIEPPAALKSGSPAMFQARFRDDPAATARARLHWADAFSCDGARDLIAAEARMMAPPMVGIATYAVKETPRREFCVVVEGTDEFETPVSAHLMVTNIERGPLPVAIAASSERTVPDPDTAWPLYSAIRLQGLDPAALGPADTVAFSWRLLAPDGRVLEPQICPDAALPGGEICFVVDLVGTYRVELTVTEGGRAEVAPPLDLLVKDFPPCIRNTDPLYASAPKFFQAYDRDQVFHLVEVDDDGDPWPPPARGSQRGFVWSIREGGPQNPFRVRVNARFESFTLPARSYRPGDRIEVQVKYFDRQDLLELGARDWSACPDSAASCELAPGCYQAVSWTVEYL